MNTVKRTERGWAGHFICAQECQFRRNTLLECGEDRIVVSTVGMMTDPLNKNKYRTIGVERHFETMAFRAVHDGRYWDADVGCEVGFDSPWSIAELDADDRANEMHDTAVAEITQQMADGKIRWSK